MGGWPLDWDELSAVSNQGWGGWPGLPSAAPPPVVKGEKLSGEGIREVEDAVRDEVEKMTPFKQATLYLYLHKLGMTAQKAGDIRRKEGATI